MTTYPRLSFERVCIQRVVKGATIRTAQGRGLFKMVGECIAAGGSVQMDITDDYGLQHATGILDYAPVD